MKVIPETFMCTKYKFVGPSEVISSKQKKTEIKLDINLLSKTNKYKTKQTNQTDPSIKKNWDIDSSTCC
jgi:hypothetical protein